MTIRVIDLETTGTEPETDQIVEVASLDITREFGMTNPQEDLVFPGMKIPATAAAIHHILDEDVKDKPRFAAVAKKYLGAKAYVAHNADFERSFLERHGFAGPWVCTYKVALRVWPELPRHTNQFLRYHLGLANPFGKDRKTIDPHRALSDCIVTGAIFAHMLQHKLCRWTDMVAWSAEPPLYTVFSFGKFEGKRWDDPSVDEGYLDWILSSQTMSEGHKHSARYWKARRAAARKGEAA